jgi:hypothetical protein
MFLPQQQQEDHQVQWNLQNSNGLHKYSKQVFLLPKETEPWRWHCTGSTSNITVAMMINVGTTNGTIHNMLTRRWPGNAMTPLGAGCWGNFIDPILIVPKTTGARKEPAPYLECFMKYRELQGCLSPYSLLNMKTLEEHSQFNVSEPLYYLSSPKRPIKSSARSYLMKSCPGSICWSQVRINNLIYLCKQNGAAACMVRIPSSTKKVTEKKPKLKHTRIYYSMKHVQAHLWAYNIHMHKCTNAVSLQDSVVHMEIAAYLRKMSVASND